MLERVAPLDFERAADSFEPIDPASTYLAPNTQDIDETPAFVHHTREDMPLRINLTRPRVAALNTGIMGTRQAVIDGIKAWAPAIQRVYPWFAMEFVENDPDAPIQVEWKRRITGPWAGFGGIGWEVHDGEFRVRGHFEYATKMCPGDVCIIDVGELRELAAHEFGHVLGLGHCIGCDSAMAYDWRGRDEVLVTEFDVQTYRALMEIPSGTRVDGARMKALD